MTAGSGGTGAAEPLAQSWSRGDLEELMRGSAPGAVDLVAAILDSAYSRGVADSEASANGALPGSGSVETSVDWRIKYGDGGVSMSTPRRHMVDGLAAQFSKLGRVCTVQRRTVTIAHSAWRDEEAASETASETADETEDGAESGE